MGNSCPVRLHNYAKQPVSKQLKEKIVFYVMKTMRSEDVPYEEIAKQSTRTEDITHRKPKCSNILTIS